MINRFFKRSMSFQGFVMKYTSNANIAEKRLSELKHKLEEIKKIKIQQKIKILTAENLNLRKQIEHAKATLIELELLNGKKQYSIPRQLNTATSLENETKDVSSTTHVTDTKEKKDKTKLNTDKKEKDITNKQKPDSEFIVDVRKLDFRIGKIVEINKHPDADALYVEKIDCGEEKPRTVVSGLVNHVPIEEMQNRMVMVLCNLKPAKMRGVTSEAMVMCASSPQKIEVLVPPKDAVPGDLVTCEGYPREPEVQLNPKKKIFETCAPDLATNEDRVACYKGQPLVVPGKGPIVATSLNRVSVK